MQDYIEAFGQVDAEGPILMSCELPGGTALISGWVGARLTLMIDRGGRDVLRLKLNMPPEPDEEE